jgi:hypothetical protein
MSSVKSYRPKNVPNSKWMQNEFENTAALLYSKHCCSFLLADAKAGANRRSIDFKWMGRVGSQSIECLTDKYLMAGVIVVLKWVVRPKKGEQIGWSPSFARLLATYNDFLQPSRFEVRSALTGLADLDVQLNAPTGASRIGKDVVRAMIQRRMEKTS